MNYEQRVRSNFPDGTHQFYANVYPDGSLQAPFTVSKALIDGGAAMVDYITGTPPPWAFKPCSHVTWELEAVQETGESMYSHSSCAHHWWYESGYRGHNLVQNKILAPADTEGCMNSLAPPIVSFDHYAFKIKRMIEKEMSNITDSPTDLIVFLLELGEIRATAKYIMKKWKILTDLQDSMIGGLNLIESIERLIILKSSHSGTLKLAADALSDDLLQISFGLVPLISDISGLAQRVSKFWKLYEDLKKGSGKAHKVKKRFVDEDFDPGFDDIGRDLYTCPHGTCEVDRYDWWNRGWTSPEVAVTIMYRYDLPDDWDALSGKIGYALSALGIKPGLATVWERIPFSFVVDWVFSVGSLLDPFKIDPSRIKVSLLDVCASVRSGQTAELYHRYCQFNFLDSPLLRINRTDYDRRVGRELLNALPPLTLPTNFQLLLGAALLWTKGANKHLR